MLNGRNLPEIAFISRLTVARARGTRPKVIFRPSAPLTENCPFFPLISSFVLPSPPTLPCAIISGFSVIFLIRILVGLVCIETGRQPLGDLCDLKYFSHLTAVWCVYIKWWMSQFVSQSAVLRVRCSTLWRFSTEYHALVQREGLLYFRGQLENMRSEKKLWATKIASRW